MIVRCLDEVPTVEWGNGLSRRFLLAADGLGFSVTDTTVKAGSTSPLRYRRHLEACYCIAGEGSITDESGTTHPISPGVLYVLDKHDAHHLTASVGGDLRLVCVFTPALAGDEQHDLDPAGFSEY